jgi:hypothetical protein
MVNRGDLSKPQENALYDAIAANNVGIIAAIRQDKSSNIDNSLIALANRRLEQEQILVADRRTTSAPTATAASLAAPAALAAPALPSALPLALPSAVPAAVPAAASSQSSAAVSQPHLIPLLTRTRSSVLSNLTAICNILRITPPDVSRLLLSTEPAIQSNDKIDVRKFLIDDITLVGILRGIETAITRNAGTVKESVKKYTDTDTLFTEEIRQICSREVDAYRDKLRSLTALVDNITSEGDEIIDTIKKTAGEHPVLTLGPVSPDDSGVAAILTQFDNAFQNIHALIVNTLMPEIAKFQSVVHSLDGDLSVILQCVRRGFDTITNQIGEVLQILKQDHASAAGIIAQIKGMEPTIESS